MKQPWPAWATEALRTISENKRASNEDIKARQFDVDQANAGWLAELNRYIKR